MKRLAVLAAAALTLAAAAPALAQNPAQISRAAHGASTSIRITITRAMLPPASRP